MNFGFNFEDQQEDLNKINQNFYRKLLEDKLKLISGEDFGKMIKIKKKMMIVIVMMTMMIKIQKK